MLIISQEHLLYDRINSLISHITRLARPSLCPYVLYCQPWAVTHRIAQPGELCAMQQSSSSKIRASKLWNTKEQSGRGFNLAATSASGHVTTALASAAPKLDSTPINKLTDDKRSVVPTAQSIHVLVLYGLITRQRRRKKTKLVWTFPRAGVTGVPIFSSKGQRSALGLGQRSMSPYVKNI